MERVRCGAAVYRRIRQRIDDLQLLDDRAGPPVCDDERQGIVMLRTNVNEMNVQSVDLRDELRQGVEFRFDLAPVVVRRPIAREFLHRREPHTLRFIRDRFLLGPLGLVYAPAQFRKFLFRNAEGERTDRVAFAVFLGGDDWTGGKQTGGTCCSRSGQDVASGEREGVLGHGRSP